MVNYNINDLNREYDTHPWELGVALYNCSCRLLMIDYQILLEINQQTCWIQCKMVIVFCSLPILDVLPTKEPVRGKSDPQFFVNRKSLTQKSPRTAENRFPEVTMPPKKRNLAHSIALYWPDFQSLNLHWNLMIFAKTLPKSCISWIRATLWALIFLIFDEIVILTIF